MEPRKITNLDPNQIPQYTFDEINNAQRVIIVGDGYIPTNEAPQIKEFTKVEKIEVPVIIKEVEIKEVNIPVIIKEVEIKEVSVPFIEKRVEFVEKPLIVKEVEIKEIRVPEIIKQIEYKEVEKNTSLPLVQKVCLILQTVFVFGLLLCHIFKK